MATLVEHDHLSALDQTIIKLERALAPAYPDTPGHYGLEPLPIPAFLRGMRRIGHPRGRRFLDVGCGIGTKLLLARLLGWSSVTGIEWHEPYIAVARTLVPEASLMNADALTFDGYGAYDVVYSYRLCIADGDQRQLEELIVGQLQTGALLFAPSSVLGDEIGESLGDDVWRIR